MLAEDSGAAGRETAPNTRSGKICARFAIVSKSLTDTLKQSGLEVAVEERESDECLLELLVIVKKPVGVRDDG